ncbi:MAG: multifunctional CCA addition/repair protein [Candidatus Berkiellales bacterium]
MKIYLVGGAVRDELLGQPISERDYVVIGAKPTDLLAQGFIPVGKSFPVFLHPQTKEEYALARTERKVAGGYHGFEFDTSMTVTLEEDLARRDLTINAMAKSEQGDIIDPYGGQKDLKNRILRHVSPAFVEDPVRVLRVARFAARYASVGFKVVPETLALMQQMVIKGELDYLVPERIWKEMSRALTEETPVAFIQTLRQCHALKIILPEIDRLYGIPQSEKSHPEKDTGIHIELVLQQATRLSKDPEVRFAALMHDVGKGITPPAEWPKHRDHEASGEQIARALCERLRVPNDFQQLAQMVAKYHGACHDAMNKNAEAILQLLEKCDAFRRRDRFLQFLVACEADFRGRPGYETADYPVSNRWLAALQAAEQVDVRSVIANLSQAKPSGEEVKNAIYQARIKAIENISGSAFPPSATPIG